MGRSSFQRRLDETRGSAGRERGVHLGGQFASWDQLSKRAGELRPLLREGGQYLVDPSAGLQAFAALIAVMMTPRSTLIWALRDAVPCAFSPVATGLFHCDDPPPVDHERPMYATLTSGSSGEAKIPVAFADVLELVALQYDTAMYQSAFEGSPDVNVYATCLPLEYAAVFMMMVVPALFLGRDLVVFDNHRWDVLLDAARRERVVCLIVPALVAAASAALAEPVSAANLAFIFTAGHLSRARRDVLAEKFRGATLLASYGASETGVMTLDREPGEATHVGSPLWGKAVWIAEPDESGVGKISTTGPDCRESYWGKNQPLRDAAGVVASTDYGHFDPQGHLVLDGRIDGAQKFHGRLIYPKRIERHILLLPGVEDVRIRLLLDGNFDRIEALVVGSCNVDTVREHCAELPELYRPGRIECVLDGAKLYNARGKL